MTNAIETYVAALCFLHGLARELPAWVNQALTLLGEGGIAATGVALALVAFWFEGTTPPIRLANQRAALRGLVGVVLAVGLAAASRQAWQWAPGGPELARSFDGLPCWHGPPSVSIAAAVGVTLGAALWRRDWRWGLGFCLAGALWADLQVIRGLAYPLDVVVGTLLGVAVGWLFGSATWLDRWLAGIIRLARRLALS